MSPGGLVADVEEGFGDDVVEANQVVVARNPLPLTGAVAKSPVDEVVKLQKKSQEITKQKSLE